MQQCAVSTALGDAVCGWVLWTTAEQSPGGWSVEQRGPTFKPPGNGTHRQEHTHHPVLPAVSCHLLWVGPDPWKLLSALQLRTELLSDPMCLILGKGFHPNWTLSYPLGQYYRTWRRTSHCPKLKPMLAIRPGVMHRQNGCLCPYVEQYHPQETRKNMACGTHGPTDPAFSCSVISDSSWPHAL